MTNKRRTNLKIRSDVCADNKTNFDGNPRCREWKIQSGNGISRHIGLLL